MSNSIPPGGSIPVSTIRSHTNRAYDCVCTLQGSLLLSPRAASGSFSEEIELNGIVDSHTGVERNQKVEPGMKTIAVESATEQPVDKIVSLLSEILVELQTKNRHARLWDLDDLALYFKLSKDSIYKRILSQPGFPRAIRIQGVGRRWPPNDVKDWALRHRQKPAA